MAEPDLPVVPDLEPSPRAWLDAVLADFPAFLRDHASAEKKASGMAMNMASHYPDQPALLKAMVDLAVEELNHYREVIRIMMARNIVPGADTKDPYVRALNALVRKGPENFLMDRLLVGAIVERRGAERFALVADGLTHHNPFADDADVDPRNANPFELAKFYQAIAASEARHWVLFYELALNHCDAKEVPSRYQQLNEQEAEIMLACDLRAALH